MVGIIKRGNKAKFRIYINDLETKKSKLISLSDGDLTLTKLYDEIVAYLEKVRRAR